MRVHVTEIGRGNFFCHFFVIGFSGHPYLYDKDDVREWERQLANLDFLFFLGVLKKLL